MLVRSDDSEYSSLLDTQQQHDRFYNSLYPPSTIFDGSHQTRQRSHSAILSSCASVNSYVRDDQSVVCRLFNKRLGQYDDDRQELLNENTGVRVWYESYSSIDWIHDHIKEGVRLRKLRNIASDGWRGRWIKMKDASQAWILVTLTGTTVALVAWIVDVVQEWMSDLKTGYCTTNWRYNSKFCCWDRESGKIIIPMKMQPLIGCSEWRTWSEIFGNATQPSSYYTDMAMYSVLGLFFAWIASTMVKYTAETIVVTTPSAANDKDQLKDVTKPETKTVYYTSGSGIPEVKVILAGFVIKSVLGIKAFLVKGIGMIFATSAGLTTGKEGPFVHLAASAANIYCRLFDKFNKNEAKRREILSASTAAGVAVAFGAPIGGVLFTLEEVSYYFPIKTMIRSFCCAMVAATILKIADPFGTGKIVMYQVHYDKDFHVFELLPFLLCGAIGGFLGAATTYINVKFQYLRKSTALGKYPVWEVLGIMVVTILLNYWNPFGRISLSEFAVKLFSQCSPEKDDLGLCVTDSSEIPRILTLLLITMLIKIFLAVITFGCRIPGGIFLPMLIIGGIAGRMIGLSMQHLVMTYPDAWPFNVCSAEIASDQQCIIPGVYAMVGAAAALTGMTRTTVSLVVIMFELTYSLAYSVPIMISVMMAKWVSDAMYLDGLYDLLIEMQGYPFLDSRKTFPHSLHTVRDLVTEQGDEEHPFIDMDDDPITLGSLYKKLEAVDYAEDGGFPILSNGGRTLEGYIATSELSFALDQLSTYCYTSPYPITEQECMNYHVAHMALFQAPLTINQNASMELLTELFIKLGSRYICVTRSDGQYISVIHKRTLLAYIETLDQHT
ncbi:hypothetical protein K492DRAFT_126685 [Lichtheimia hyalospora FSU 10163]|nr:hypothetical protein K492DRAFT_126685 [Lichtheimia hyalospora FSU 10163]